MSAVSSDSLQITAEFLGCDKTELNAALVSRTMQTPVGGRRGSAIMYASGCDFSYSMNIVYNAVIVYLYVVDSIVLLQC